MSFWQSQSGTPIDGSVENSHAYVMKVIPDNTRAIVSIKDVELKNIQGDEFYQATYKIIDGEFKGCEVRHKIKCFDNDKKKRDREVNMLLRLFKLCSKTPPAEHAPTKDELLQLKGSVIGIKVQEWFFDGKEGNWVSEIHASDGFVSEAGKKAVHDLSSAFSRNESRVNGLESDVPF
jgi:hypothetical protein